MSRPRRRLQLRRHRLRSDRISIDRANQRFTRSGFEPLEKRCLLTATLALAGAQTLPGGANIDASNDHATQQQNNSIDINPINPLHLAGLSQRNTPTNSTTLGLYRSLDGGLTWTTTTIDNTVDTQSATARRFDPALAYDSNGNLYVTYGVDNGTTTTLIALTSTDDGATFTQVKTVASIADAIGSISKPGIGTGPDGLGNQAVYIAFTESAIGVPGILASGSHDGGATFTSPVLVSDLAHNVTDAHPAVGPAGQLYVSWLDATDSAVRFDRDLDGLFAAVNSFGADVTVVNNSTARPSLSGNFQIFFNQLVPAQPNHGINSQPELAADRSAGVTSGTLYISFADLFNAAGNDVDIYVARSVNQGANWTFAPVATGSATEFLPALAVDQSSGSVNVLYYSTLGDTAAGNDDVNTMLATSFDAGQTFANNQKLSTATSRASTILGGNDFGDYIGLAALDGTIQGMWADNRGPSLEVEAMTASASFASATDGNALTVIGTTSADTILIRRSAANHAFVEIVVNGQLQYAGLLATLDSTIVNTLDASDSLTIDNTNGVVSSLITYDGGTSAGDHDTLAITGNPGVSIARETYLAGATTGTGTEVVDPDGSRGAGLTTAGNGDELTVNFSNLEPIQTDIPVVIFDVILNTSDNVGTVQDGGLLNGANSLQLVSGNATFESVQFAKKVTARIMGNSGADTLTADYTTAAVGLVGLELYGHLAADVLGQPADDNLADTLKVLRNAAGVSHLLHGNGGDDNFTVGNGDLSLILSPVNVIGDAGNDSLIVDDSVRTVAVDYYVDPTTIAICTNPGPPPVHANIALYDATLENARLNGTQGINRFDVTPSADTTLFIDGNEPHVLPGDLLSIRFAGTTGAQLTNTAGAGMWSFTNRKSVQFEDIERFNSLPVIVYGAEAAKNGKPTVKVVDAATGALITSFLAYESSYTGGVRVAVGDINGDGIPEIITAPGLKHLPTIKIFNILTGAEMTGMAFSAYPNAFVDGVNVAIGDVNADGLNDIVTSPSHGKTEIHTYLNQTATNPAVPFDNDHRNRFLAFDKSFIGGGTVAVGDVSDDAKAEILIGSGAGMRDEVRKFDGMTNGSVSTAAPFLQHFKPFDASVRGGVTVAVANLDADPKMEIVVGTGTGGHGQMATFDTSNLSVPLHTFVGVYTGNGSDAPVRIAAIDSNFDGISNIFTAQGPDGRSQEIRQTGPVGPLVDFLMDNDIEFRNGFYLAADVNGTATFMC